MIVLYIDGLSEVGTKQILQITDQEIKAYL